jgi:hypothetical protein
VDYLDDNPVPVASFTSKVSSYPMHWVLPSESASGSWPAGSDHIKIVAETRTP